MNQATTTIIMRIDGEVSRDDADRARERLLAFLRESGAMDLRVVRDEMGSWYLEVVAELPILVAGALLSYVATKMLDGVGAMMKKLKTAKVPTAEEDAVSKELTELVSEVHPSNYVFCVRYAQPDGNGSGLFGFAAARTSIDGRTMQVQMMGDNRVEVDKAFENIVTPMLHSFLGED